MARTGRPLQLFTIADLRNQRLTPAMIALVSPDRARSHHDQGRLIVVARTKVAAAARLTEVMGQSRCAPALSATRRTIRARLHDVTSRRLPSWWAFRGGSLEYSDRVEMTWAELEEFALAFAAETLGDDEAPAVAVTADSTGYEIASAPALEGTD